MKKKLLPLVLIGLAVLCVCAAFFFRDYAVPLHSDVRITSPSDTQTDSLYRLCKIWGYMKYRHPDIVSGKTDWDQELLDIMPEVLNADTSSEAEQVLYGWLEGYPLHDVEEEPKRPSVLDDLLRPGDPVGSMYTEPDESWIHDPGLFGEEITAYLSELSEISISDRDRAYASFSKRYDLRVSFENEDTFDFDIKDSGVKLLALFRFWSAYEYYSPYIQLTKTDWDSVLLSAIPEVLSADTYEEYVRSIARAAAQTGDAHIFIEDRQHVMWYFYGKYFLQCSVKYLDGQVVVRQTAESEEDLMPGDILLQIDGTPVEDRLDELYSFYAVSRPEKILGQAEPQFLQTREENAVVTVLRDGRELDLQVTASRQRFRYDNPLQSGLIYNDRIGYLAPSSLKDEDELHDLMETFSKTDGLIIDMRRYPSVPVLYLLGEYLIPEPREFARMAIPDQEQPGYFYSPEGLYCCGSGWMSMTGMDKGEYPHYNGEVILLMDENSKSQSEFTVMALRQSDNATVVGSSSAGADGDIATLELPGFVTITFSGIGVYTPAGDITQGVGLTPDVICTPTPEGFAQGRDELVEKGIELIYDPDKNL